MKFLTSILLLLVAAVLLSVTSCVKETVPQSPIVIEDTIAVFAPVASDDNCIFIESPGTLHTGAALTTQQITLDVTVTKAGEYEYATDTLNGYYFSTEGSFADTGIHTITLIGHGTPIIAGNSRFKFPYADLHQTVAAIDPSSITPQAVPAGVYVKGTFGNEEVDVSMPFATADGPSASSGTDTISVSSFVSTGNYPDYPAGTGDLSLQKQFLSPFINSTEEDFKAFFAPGAYPISFIKCSTHIMSTGIWVAWVEGQNQAWLLRRDFDQEGSYFQILGNEDGHRPDGKYFVKVFSRLKCNLYHETTNEMKTLDVEIVSYFIRPPASN